jgi:hypothetical protein
MSFIGENFKQKEVKKLYNKEMMNSKVNTLHMYNSK